MLKIASRFGLCSLAFAALISFCPHAKAQSGYWDITDYTVTMPPVAGTDPTSALSSNGVTYTLSPPAAYALILHPGVTGVAEVYGMREATWNFNIPVAGGPGPGGLVAVSKVLAPRAGGGTPTLLQVNLNAVAQGVVDANPELNLSMDSSASITANTGISAEARGAINLNGPAPADPNAHYSDDSSKNGKGIVSGIYDWRVVGYVLCKYEVKSGGSGKGAYSYAKATISMYVTGGMIAN